MRYDVARFSLVPARLVIILTAPIWAGATECGGGIDASGLEDSQVSYNKTASVSGTVQDSQTHNPVLGATVKVADVVGTTDTAGSFYIASVRAGSQTLTIDAEGYQPFSTTVDLQPGANAVGPFAIAASGAVGGAGPWPGSRLLATRHSEYASAVTMDQTGNMYVAGSTEGDLVDWSAGYDDAFVAKYDPDRNQVWVRQFGSASSDFARGIGTDAAENVFVVGDTEGDLGGTVAGDCDGFAVKFDSSGNRQWSRQFGSAEDDHVTNVLVGSDGSVFVVGWTYGTLTDGGGGWADAFAIKYDTTGTQIWTWQFGTLSDEQTVGAGLDPEGNLLVAGETMNALPGGAEPGHFLVKLGSDGIERWVRRYPRAADGHVYWDGMAAAKTGDVYLAGQSYSADLTYDTEIVAKLDTQGNPLWTREFDTHDGSIWDIAADDAGNVYVAGDTSGDLSGTNAGREDAFVVKLTTAGAIAWERQFGSRYDDNFFAVSTDSLGNVAVAGCTRGDIDDAPCDAVFMKLDEQGTPRW